MTRSLYPHQTDAIAMLRHSLARGHKRPMLMAPTGFGKTIIAAEVVKMARSKGNRICFSVPSISLIDQTVEKFGSEGITDIGVIQADHPLTNSEMPVQIASVQTLSRRSFPGTDLVLVDEAHQAFKAIFQWMALYPDLPFVGLSATPWTKGLGKHYDDLIIAATTADLIDKGFLSKFQVYAPSKPDLKGVRTVAGDYHEGQLAEAMDKPELTADIVTTWLKLGENRPTLCFAVNRGHARKLQDEFQSAGVQTAYVDAFTDRAERTRIGEAFNAGRIKVVCNVGTLTTGVDWDVRCLILARPTKSEMLYTQIIGRALRTAEGKNDALILDHSNTTLELGFVTDINHEYLDRGRMAESRSRASAAKAALPKECAAEGCSYLKPAGVHKCPACGFEPQHRADIATGEGDLLQISGAQTRADKATKQQFWSGLMWYRVNYGKTEKWAKALYRNKFGVWPQSLRDIPAQPTQADRHWIKYSQIAYAKRMEKQREAERSHV